MIKLQLTALTAAAFCALAGSAFAAAPVIAKLKTPVAKPAQFVAGGGAFACQGDTCVAAAPTDNTTDPAACRTLAHQVGEFVSFGTEKRPYTANQLAICNGNAKK